MGYFDPPDDDELLQENETSEEYMLRTGKDTYGNRLSAREYFYLTHGDLD